MSFALEKQRKEIEEFEEKLEKEGEIEEDVELNEELQDDEDAIELGQLASDANKASFEGDDEDDDDDDDDFNYMEEDENRTEAVDNINEIVYLVDILKQIASSSPQYYSQIINQLDPHYQIQYKNLVELAEKQRAESIAAKEEAK